MNSRAVSAQQCPERKRKRHIDTDREKKEMKEIMIINISFSEQLSCQSTAVSRAKETEKQVTQLIDRKSIQLHSYINLYFLFSSFSIFIL